MAFVSPKVRPEPQHPLLRQAMASTPPAAIAAPQPAQMRTPKTSDPTPWVRFSGQPPDRGQGEAPIDDGLGLLTFRVQALLQGSPPDWSAVETAARTQLEQFGVNARAQAVDVLGAAAKAVPTAVREANRFFQDNIEAAGWGEVRVLETTVGARLDEVFVVHARTFAGDGYLEVYDDQGAPLLSGTTERSRVDAWDESFGEVRELAGLLAG